MIIVNYVLILGGFKMCPQSHGNDRAIDDDGDDDDDVDDDEDDDEEEDDDDDGDDDDFDVT